MKTITLHLTEVNTESCEGCYYRDEDDNCLNPSEELDCIDNKTCYIFEEGTE